MSNNFEASTQVQVSDENLHHLDISDLWNVGRIPNGGYLMAHVGKSMAARLVNPHPISVTGYYLDKSENKTADVHHEVLREGKSISTVSSKLIQDGSERIRFTAAFSDLDKTRGENFCEAAAPSIAAFDSCIPVSEVAPSLRMYEQFNMRFDPDSTGWNDGSYKNKAEMNVWLEYRDQSAFDVFSLLMVPDILPPVVFTRFGAKGWVPTIEMTVNIRAVPNTNRLQLRGKTRYLTQGLLEEDVEVWDDKGNILALSRQLAKLRMK